MRLWGWAGNRIPGGEDTQKGGGGLPPGGQKHPFSLVSEPPLPPVPGQQRGGRKAITLGEADPLHRLILPEGRCLETRPAP